MIKAYQILNLWECQITHQVLVSITFQLGDEKKAFLHPMPNMAFAKTYLDKEARDWFLPALEKFIHHKSHIITTEQHPNWKQLQTCKQAFEAYQGWATAKICEKFLNGYENFFKAILPHPHNDSYESSVHDLNELKKFCEEYLRFVQLKQAA